MSDSKKEEIPASDNRIGAGKLFIVGLGPGGKQERTPAMVEAIRESKVIVGYTPYVDSIADLTTGKAIITSKMKQERKRVEAAVESAAAGKIVSLVSSGDPGIYGMAGPALEMAGEKYPGLDIEVVPGITAALSAAATLGAPLMLDFAVISLSDLLVPWEEIESRLEGAAHGGFTTVFYNPKSHRRTTQIERAVAIYLKYLPPETPAAIVTAAGRPEEKKVITTLKELLQQEITMVSIVVIANKRSTIVNGRLVTKRGYSL